MKTDLFPVSADVQVIANILDEVERAAVYCGLNTKNTNILRLLAEESIAMTTDVLKQSEGLFWLERTDNAFDIHITVKASVTETAREAFIAVSSAKRSTPPKGLKNKISYLFAGLFASDPTLVDTPELYSTMAYGFMGAAYMPVMRSSLTWSMALYNQEAPAEERAADLEATGLEKSIIERFADDVVVTVTAGGVEMIVKKAF